MSPFNLGKALAGHPLVTRNGQRVREFRNNVGNRYYPYMALIESNWRIYTESGRWQTNSPDHELDLFLAEPNQRAMTAEEMIAVITAHAEGKKIEGRFKDGGGWVDASHVDSGFDFIQWEYRIKPEPRERRVIYVNDYQDGLGSVACKTEDDAAESMAISRGYIATRKFIEVIDEK